MASHSSPLAWRVPWAEGPGSSSPQIGRASDTAGGLSSHSVMTPGTRAALAGSAASLFFRGAVCTRSLKNRHALCPSNSPSGNKPETIILSANKLCDFV